MERVETEHALPVGHLLDVAAGGEDLAGPGEDDRADRGVAVGVVDGGLEGGDELAAGDRVADMRQVDRPDLGGSARGDVERGAHGPGSCRDLVCRYSSKPARPSSRPMPDFL